MTHRPKHIVEYIFVRIIAAMLRILPYRAALFLGWCVALLSFYVFRYRVAAAKRRIREIFGESISTKQVHRIAWKSWRNFMFSVVETIRIPVSTPEWIRSVVDTAETHRKITDWGKKTGKGGIIATAHMGAWELAALYCLRVNIPLFSLAAQQKNRLVDDFLNRARAGTGFETLLRTPSVIKNIIRNIHAGKFLAILPDVRGKTDALAIAFLGKTANVAGGMGFIARQTNVPVFPVMITRIGWTRHRYRVFDPIFPDEKAEKQADALRITQAYFNVLSECIRSEPEQWFWFNKRWIFDPLQEKG
jgi:Kdo2-lipid IVA lauroyltransferase/acyltransferase